MSEFATYTVRGKTYRRTWCKQCYNAQERPKARARYHARKAREGRALLEQMAVRQRARMREKLADPAYRARHNAKNARWLAAHRGEFAFDTHLRARKRAYYERLKADPVRYERRKQQKREYARRKRAETKRDGLGQTET